MRTRATRSGDLSHVDRDGKACMVDVGRKPDTRREAVARGRVSLRPRTLSLIARRKIPKGDVFTAARLAAIMAAKRVGDLIPLCHPLCLTHVAVDLAPHSGKNRAYVDIEARASLVGKTGVEMEALTAVSVAALAIYDMCKAVDRSMRITGIQLVSKKGGAVG